MRSHLLAPCLLILITLPFIQAMSWTEKQYDDRFFNIKGWTEDEKDEIFDTMLAIKELGDSLNLEKPDEKSTRRKIRGTRNRKLNDKRYYNKRERIAPRGLSISHEIMLEEQKKFEASLQSQQEASVSASSDESGNVEDEPIVAQDEPEEEKVSAISVHDIMLEEEKKFEASLYQQWETSVSESSDDASDEDDVPIVAKDAPVLAKDYYRTRGSTSTAQQDYYRGRGKIPNVQQDNHIPQEEATIEKDYHRGSGKKGSKRGSRSSKSSKSSKGSKSSGKGSSESVCPDPDSTSLPCPDPQISRVCDKYNEEGDFKECFNICKNSFCCVHDSRSRRVAPTCAKKESNCRAYDPCYIVWWKLSNTVGPAPYFYVSQQGDDYFPEFDDYIDTFDDVFMNQLLGHYFDDDIVQEGRFENSTNW